MNLTIGCTTRPFRDLDLPNACRRIASAGYTDVALFHDAGIDGESPREEVLKAREIVLDAGLNPSMLLAAPKPEKPDAAEIYKHLIDNAAALGSRWLLDLGTSDVSLTDAYVALMRNVTPHAAEAGIHISLKPHGGITLSTGNLVDIYNRVDHPAFGICYDPGNIIYYTKGAEMPEQNVDRVAPLVTTGIIKDCALENGRPDVMITPGEGLVNFQVVLQALVNAGFKGPLYTECVGGSVPDEIERNARRTREMVSGMMDGISA